MPFGHLVGNLEVKEQLLHAVESGRVGQALLFSGPAGVGKRQFARAFARLLICGMDPVSGHKADTDNHPDIHVYRPSGKVSMHSIDSLRQLREEVALPPNEASRKIFILEEAERMLPTSSNALLKTFEEPTPGTVIVLVTDHPSMLLPTIHSRCRHIHFQALPEAKIREHLEARGVDAGMAERYAMLAQGSLGTACELVRDGENPMRQRILQVLADGGVRRYGDLRGLAQQLAEMIEQRRNKEQAEEEERLTARAGEYLTAVQKEEIRKQVDGSGAHFLFREVEALMEMIQGWYRDILLVRLNGDRNLLVHRDFREQIESAAKEQRRLPTLDHLQQSISEAVTSVRRSTTLSLCLETLFLKLGLVG